MPYYPEQPEKLRPVELLLTESERASLWWWFEQFQYMYGITADPRLFLRYITIRGDFGGFLPETVQRAIRAKISVDRWAWTWSVEHYEQRTPDQTKSIRLDYLSDSDKARLSEVYGIHPPDRELGMLLTRGFSVLEQYNILKRREPTYPGMQEAHNIAESLKKPIELLNDYIQKREQGEVVNPAVDGFVEFILPYIEYFVKGDDELHNNHPDLNADSVGLKVVDLPAMPSLELPAYHIEIKPGRPSEPHQSVLAADLADILPRWNKQQREQLRTTQQYKRSDIGLILKGMGGEFAPCSEDLDEWVDNRIKAGKKLRVGSQDTEQMGAVKRG